MAAKDMERRRKIRQLEAKRDTLSERISRDRISLAQIRAALKQMRTVRRRR